MKNNQSILKATAVILALSLFTLLLGACASSVAVEENGMLPAQSSGASPILLIAIVLILLFLFLFAFAVFATILTVAIVIIVKKKKAKEKEQSSADRYTDVFTDNSGYQQM